MPGVHAVLTHEDVPGEKRYGLEFPDQPVLAFERVRYFGEPVAIVAAEQPEQARRAAGRGASRVRAARAGHRPRARHRVRSRSTPSAGRDGHGYRDDPRPNVVRTIVIRHGDPDAEAEVAVEGTYELGIQDQAFLGPESGLAVPDGEGGVDIYVATQWLHVDRDQVAPCLGLTPNRVRIHLAGVGGAFGGREDLSMQIHGAMLALHTNRPVKFVYNREESFVGHIHRHPARIWMRHGANRDGKLVSVRARILLDGGAYASSSTAVTSNAASFACGPYSVPNALLEATCVYTNNPPCGAMRGFGSVQSCFAHEAQMDKLADALALGRVELRLRNALGPGDVLPTGQVVTGSLPVAEVIRRCADIPMPDPEELPRDPIRLPGGAGNTTRGEGVRRGVGFAVGFKNICYSEGFDDFCAARVRLFADADGELVAEVHSAAAEVGQGVVNVMAQVARTELERRERRRRAAHDRGRAVRRLVLRLAADVDDRRRRPARLPRGQAGARAPRRRARARRGDQRRARLPPRAHVSARPGDGPGRRRRARPRGVCLRGHAGSRGGGRRPRPHPRGLDRHRPGRRHGALNPQAVYGQIEGGTAQGLGLALMEEIQTKDGLITNASFTDYLIPTALDMPPVWAELVEDPEPDAPYGVKGVGEPPTRRLDRRRSSPPCATPPAASWSACPCGPTRSWGST